MKLTKQQKEALTPLGRWLLDYVRDQETNLTALSRGMGMSNNTLRALILYPERTPSLETCLLLAKATGKTQEDLIHLAGLKIPETELKPLDPDRIKLLRIFDNMQPYLQRTLLQTAEAIQTADRTE